MTKSRTLRRAGAVVLSLAMAATTVFAGGVDSKAASKVKLSSTKKTFAAKGGTATVKIKGATSAKISSTTVKSSKTSVATVKKSSKVKFKVTAKKNTTTKKKTATITAKVKIAKKYQKKYTKKSYSLKYKVTVKAAAAPTEVPPAIDVKLEAKDTPQADGSYKAPCELKLSYGSDLGTPYSITWYKNKVVDSVYTTDGGSLVGSLNHGNITGTAVPCTAGEWYVEVKNTNKDVYTSNPVTLVDDEVGAVLKDFKIVDDTATEDETGLSFAKADEKAVASVTLNRAYDGTFYVFASDNDKPTKNTKIAARKSYGDAGTQDADGKPTADKWTRIDKAKNFTAANALIADDGCITFENPDKTVTYMFATKAVKIERGYSYYVVFDQDAENIKDNLDADDSTKNEAINKFATPATVPYVAAPSSVVIEGPIAKSDVYKATLNNAEGKDYKQLNGNDKTASSVKVYTTSDKEVGSTKAYTSGKVNITTGADAAVGGVSYYAKWTGDKDVYGKEAVEVKSEPKVARTAAATTVSVDNNQAKDMKHTVNVGLTSVLTAGKVYITDDKSKFDATKADTYVSVSGAVAKGDKTVKIENAVSKKGTTYTAVFVPDDQEKYGNVESNTFSVSPAIAAYSMTKKTGVTPGIATGDVLEATDQFGDPIALSTTPLGVDLVSIDEKASTLIGADAKVDTKVESSDTSAPIIDNGSGADAKKWTIKAGALAPSKGETYVAKLVNDSYLVVTCDSAAATAADSTWTIYIENLSTTKGVIIPDNGSQVAATLVGATTEAAAEEGNGSAKTDSLSVKVLEDFKVADQFGNIMKTAGSKAGIVGTGTNPGLTPATGKKLTVSWNTDGLVIGLEYNAYPAASTDDVYDVLGCKIAITVNGTNYSGGTPAIDVADPEQATIACTGATTIKYIVSDTAKTANEVAEGGDTYSGSAFDATSGLTTGTYKIYAVGINSTGRSEVVSSGDIVIS